MLSLDWAEALSIAVKHYFACCRQAFFECRLDTGVMRL
jgi:hypothetical protein